MRFPDYSLLALPDRSRSCRRSKPIRSHQEISRNFPARIDLLNHLQGQRSMSSQHFGRARARTKNFGKLGLGVAELVNGVAQHIDRVEPPKAPERPSPLLVGLDQGRENIELV